MTKDPFTQLVLQSQLGELVRSSPRSITFITKRIPYGVYPFNCPTSHLFLFPHLGISILRGILKSTKDHMRTGLVILIDPNFAEQTEFATLLNLYKSHNYVVRKCFGDKAKVRDAHFLTQVVPSDFIYYSTHCGESEGERYTQEFYTDDQSKHTVVYDSIHRITPHQTDQNLFQVTEFKKWVSVDGVNWDDEDNKTEEIAETLEKYINISRDKKNFLQKVKTVHKEPCKKILGASILKMTDEDYIPSFHDVGNSSAPLVFNNACFSWENLAVSYVSAGASIYIGTTLDINNLVAIEVVEKFAKLNVKGRTISSALFLAQKQFIKDLGYTPYLMAGYLYSVIPPIEKRDGKCRAIAKSWLERVYKSWITYLRQDPPSECIRNAKEAIAYLEEELRDYP